MVDDCQSKLVQYEKRGQDLKRLSIFACGVMLSWDTRSLPYLSFAITRLKAELTSFAFDIVVALPSFYRKTTVYKQSLVCKYLPHLDWRSLRRGPQYAVVSERHAKHFVGDIQTFLGDVVALLNHRLCTTM